MFGDVAQVNHEVFLLYGLIFLGKSFLKQIVIILMEAALVTNPDMELQTQMISLL